MRYRTEIFRKLKNVGRAADVATRLGCTVYPWDVAGELMACGTEDQIDRLEDELYPPPATSPVIGQLPNGHFGVVGTQDNSRAIRNWRATHGTAIAT
jgi:hypothetical protein